MNLQRNYNLHIFINSLVCSIVTLSYQCLFRTALKTSVQDSQYKLETVQKEIEGKYKAHFVPIDIDLNVLN